MVPVDADAHLCSTTRPSRRSGSTECISGRCDAPRDRIVFGTATSDADGAAGRRRGAAGFALGRGRVVVVSDPTSSQRRHPPLRVGADVRAVRMLEWLRERRRAAHHDRVRQYHQATGCCDDAGHDSRLSRPASAQSLLHQIALAALVLLLAVGPRPIPPVDVLRVERRDPLEQIDALAHAYEQVTRRAR
jgi:hypothetical protein